VYAPRDAPSSQPEDGWEEGKPWGPRGQPFRGLTRPTPCFRLLDFDGGAGALELGPGLLGILLGRLLQHGVRGAVDEILGLLEAEAREGPDFLDDLDLLVAGSQENDVELVLFLDGLGCAATTGRRGGNGHGRGRGDAELLLELLQELAELEHRHAGDALQNV